MNEPFTHIDLFESYLNDELSPSDKAYFEERLKDDPDFSQEFKAYKIGLQVIKNEGFKQEVESFMQEKRQNKAKSFHIYWLTGIAASLTLIAVFALLYLQEDSFETYYEPYPNVLSTRGNRQLDQGLEAYTKGEYDQSLQYFTQIPTPSDTILFYMGISYIETNDLEGAIKRFERIPSHSIFYPQSNWYQGLIYVRLKNRERSHQILQRIKQGEYKYEEAQKLLY